jgi:hypothetical protein
MNEAPVPGNAAELQRSSTPIPQASQTRCSNGGGASPTGGSIAGSPQRLQKRRLTDVSSAG